MPQGPQIVDLADVDLDEVSALLSAVFTEREGQRALVASWLEDTARKVLLARVDGVLVGISAAAVRRSSDLADYGEPFGVDLAVRLGDVDVGVFQLAAVRRGWQGRGVGRALAVALCRWLLDRGVVAAIGVSWDHGGHGEMGSSRGLFETAGFDEIASRTDFYRRMHARVGQTCPRCAPAPCSCPARLYLTDRLDRLDPRGR